jgi:coenzyme F420-0:L-glutamate ligase / coenzyme F420-1:gamma-L-glutamate ligase
LSELEIVPIKINKEILRGDDLTKLILSSYSKSKFKDDDILIISQKIISKQEGRTVDLSLVIPSILAIGIAAEYNKDPKLIEVILSEANRIIRMENEIIITETKNGFICANSGVDESNTVDGTATMLPLDSDKSAENIKQEILKKTGKNIAVLITDTFGRPFRMGQANCAIGVSGIDSILSYKGKKDSFGKTLRVTEIAIADELCSAAELVMGKTLNSPVAIVRNFKFQRNNGTVNSLKRTENEDIFR